MRERPALDGVVAARWEKSSTMRRAGIAALIAVIWLVPLVSASAWVGAHRAHPSSAQRADSAHITNGAALWENDLRTTAATQNSWLETAQAARVVDPAFASYYDSHIGQATLGAPLTPAFPVRQGWLQFFTSGALLLPLSQAAPAATRTDADLPDELVSNGQIDTATGVVRLPVLHTLLAAGSEIPIGGDDSPLTYAHLRDATRASGMVTAPASAIVVSQSPGPQATPMATMSATSATSSTATPATPGDVFVPGGTRDKTVIGHVVPSVIWQYITDPDISPDGWQMDFGSPLTEALPFRATVNGSPHAMLVQAFWREALLVDTTALDATGRPTITRLTVGLDYLRTLGPPAAAISPSERAWALGDMAVLDAPLTGNALAHIGMNFRLALTGQAQWLNGALWYSVHWQALKTSGTGWAPGDMVTFVSPGNAPAYAGFDVLSPALRQYLDGWRNHAAAVVYDVTRGQYYTYDPNGAFIMASSAKVPIMLTFLTMTESQGREPDGNEMYLLTTMIENSNNDSAQALFDEIGGVGPMVAFMNSVHVPGFNGDPDAWGWSTITPMAMVRLLTLLHEGKVLTAQDRALALNLMENVESDQQTGVGDTAPPGATVAMKDGWVPAPDGLWAMNSSGIVTVGSETYIISVYTQHDASLDDGWAITEKVCGTVGQLLT